MTTTTKAPGQAADSASGIANAIPSGTYVADPVHSNVGFAVEHAGVSTFRGRFAGYEARLSGGERPRLEGTVDVSSIEIAEEQLKGHLLSPDFFDAGEHPKLHFESSSLAIGEDGSVEASGRLEIAGRSREVDGITGRLARVDGYLDGRARVGLSLTATVDRRDFGLDWQAELPSGGEALDWAVAIEVDLSLVEEEG